MDRRTKFILLIIGSLLLFAAVGWFIVWPTIEPLLPRSAQGPAAQPPALPTSGSPQTPPIGNSGSVGGVGGEPGGQAVTPGGSAVSFTPTPSPDAEVIVGLARRAGILAERVESGASSNGFTNLDDAQLDVSPSLAAQFAARQEELRAAYPQTGALYLTTARRLTAGGESDAIRGAVFRVAVQLHVATRDMARPEGDRERASYQEATVTFTNNGSEWLISGYTSQPFTP